jgi:hypothetical protein
MKIRPGCRLLQKSWLKVAVEEKKKCSRAFEGRSFEFIPLKSPANLPF